MTLTSARMIPDLNHWIYQYVLNSKLNKYIYLIPSIINETSLPEKSFLELLFNENYNNDKYYYLYEENTLNSTWPINIRNRLMIYPTLSRYFEITDSTNGENIFLLQNDDLILLNALLSYRNNPDTISIIDSTSETSFDILTKILSTNYNILSTNLSKLIFLYLKLKIYNDITIYGNLTDNISEDDNILECFYESYVLDQIFIYVSSNSVL